MPAQQQERNVAQRWPGRAMERSGKRGRFCFPLGGVVGSERVALTNSILDEQGVQDGSKMGPRWLMIP